MATAPYKNDDGPTPGPASDPAPEKGRAKAPSKGRSIRRIAARLGLLLVLLLVVFAVLGVGLYLTRERTLHPLLVRVAPPIARMAAGIELSLDDIDGDWHTDLAVKGLRLSEGDADRLGVLESLEVTSASIQGDLIGLVRGRTRLDELKFVRLEQPIVRLDLTETAPKSSDESSGGLAIPALPNLTVNGGDIELKLSADTLRFTHVNIAGAASTAAPLRVEAEASANNWNVVLRGEVLRESPTQLAFSADVPNGEARGVSLQLDDLVGSWNPDETTIQAGTLAVGTSYIRPEQIVLRSGDQGLEAGGRLAFDLKDLKDAQRVVSAFQGVDAQATWAGQLRGTVDLVPMPGQVAKGNIAISGEDLFIAGVTLGTISAFATADENGIALREARASDGNGCVVRGSGQLLADRRTLKDVRLDIQLDAPDTVYPALSSVRGLRVELLLAGDFQNPQGSIDLRADTFDAGGTVLRKIAAKGALQDGVLGLTDVALESDFGEAAGSARVGLPLQGKPLDVLLQTLSWQNADAELSLNQPVPILVADGRVKIDGLSLTSGDGSADLSFDSASDEGLALDLSVKAMELEPFTAALPATEGLHFGALNGTASFRSESAATGEAAGSINLALDRSANPAFAPVAGRVQAAWRNGRIELEDVVVELDAAQLQLAGSAPLAVSGEPLGPGDVNLQGRLALDAQALGREPLRSFFNETQRKALLRASGRAFANVNLGGSWDALRGTMQVELENAKLAPKEGKEPWLPEALSGKVSVRLGDTIELESSDLSLGKTAKAVVEGSLAQSLDAVVFLSDPAERLAAWRQSDLELHADLDFQTLDWLARFLPELREASGTLSGHLAVAGTIEKPEPTGQLNLVDGGARYRGFPPIENAQVKIDLDPGQVSIERADMEIGAAPVSISGNVLHGQGNPRIDIAIKGTEVLLARSSDARIRADLDLTLQGRTNALVVGGDVFLAGGRIRSPIEFQGLLAGGSKSPGAVRRGIRIPPFGPNTVKLDLNIKTKEALSLKGRIARGSIRADMRLVGTADDPKPLGQVFFDPLQLAVPAGSISFPTGIVRFDPDSPDIPRIDLVGTTRLAGYDVTVNVDGDYDAPNVELSSSPPLAPEDLLLLVLSGQPPTQGGGIEAAGQSVALYVAKDLVRGWFSSGGFEDEDKESFLDRLQVTSGRDVSRTGTLTLEATYKIREGLARKRDAIYVVLERDSYEDYGLGLRLVVRLR